MTAPKQQPLTKQDGTDSEMAVAGDEASMVPSPDAGGDIDLPGLFRLAVEKDLDVDKLGKLVELQRQMMEMQESQRPRLAAEAFAAAKAAFQQECPPIGQNKTAKITTDSGAKFSYTYSELPEIVRVAGPIAHKHGLSFSWDSKASEGGKALIAICELRHVDGHSETHSFPAPTESRAGMSPSQKFGSAFTYAKRQSLVAALGLTTCDPDDDGAGHEPANTEAITASQLGTLVDLIRETKSDEARMLKHFGVDTLDLLPQSEFARAEAMLKSKRGPS